MGVVTPAVSTQPAPQPPDQMVKERHRYVLGQWMKPSRVRRYVDASEKVDRPWLRRQLWHRIRERFSKRLEAEGFDEVDVFRHIQRLRGELNAEVRTRVYVAELADAAKARAERAAREAS